MESSQFALDWQALRQASFNGIVLWYARYLIHFRRELHAEITHITVQIFH
jgi:hypothetical protein